jgi:hypothetical protein
MSPQTTGPQGPLFHMEPAHPGVIKLHQDLVTLYQVIREQYQSTIDKQFDQVSRQIGFVVTTTIPVNLEVGGSEIKPAFVAENMGGTIFEQTFMPTLNDLGKSMAGKIDDGSYLIYLIWYDALKLKLHTDWIEPAHTFWTEPTQLGQVGARATPGALRPGVREPAHWFRPDIQLDVQEALVISAIDQVYPELSLVDRIQRARQAPTATASAAALMPGVREPAHFRQLLEGFDSATLDKVIQVLTAIQQSR